MPRAVQRYLGMGVLVAMAAFAALGYFAIRRDVDNLRVISQDNILWTATQMEVELLRFKLSLAALEIEKSPEALEDVHARFDILWSRIFMMVSGRVGELIRRYDAEDDAIASFKAYLTALDPVIAGLRAEDSARIKATLAELEGYQRSLRLYTLRVVRGDTAATAEVRDRIQASSRTTMIVGIAAILAGLLTFFLILRDNSRQREIAELNFQIAREAELSSRAKSRFLTMMSHELRNPLNGVLGPLALLSQFDPTTRSERLIQQAQQSGRSMVQLLTGLLDYGEMQDGRFILDSEPFRPSALASSVRTDLEGAGAGTLRVTVSSDMPDLIDGDVERLRQIFVHIGGFLMDGAGSEPLSLSFRYEDGALVGELGFSGGDGAVARKLDLMTGIHKIAPDQFSAEALRPLIARGLIAATGGTLELLHDGAARRGVKVAIPAAQVWRDRVRVWLETRSTALQAIYRAALRSDQIVFIEADDPGRADIVLVDATSIGETAVMDDLRKRFPDALFVSLGAPQTADAFDDVVAGPADMTRLRSNLLRRLAS